MKNESTPSEKTIMNLRERASIMEQERRKAYQSRLSEIVAETITWNIPKEELPMKIADRAFRLGNEFGRNKMYEYI